MNESSGTIIYKVSSFVMIMKMPGSNAGTLSDGISFGHDRKKYSYISADKQMEVVFSFRKESPANFSKPGILDGGRLLLGDDCEWKDSLGQRCMANAVFIEFNLKTKTNKILSSIVGLPPVFICKSAGMVVITSDLYLLTMIPGLRLLFDPAGVHDLCSVGHPVKHRTLLKDVTMMPGGHSITVNTKGDIAELRAWNLPPAEPLRDWNEYTNLQVDIFKNAMGKLDIAESFLSLTAGLDTRAILADLIMTKRIIPAYTMTGTSISLDARTARNLYNAYGQQHTIIVLNDEFHRDLPSLAYESSRLSGGLTSLGQAHEIYLYKKISNQMSARLSGNLGNQIGRRGTERISMLNADVAILHEDIVKQNDQMQRDHWYNTGINSDDGRLTYEFLLQNEVPFSSVANYSIGNHFAIQQSPYANRKLIESTQRKPVGEQRKQSISLMKMRFNDLRHRFLGDSTEQSFQVKLILQIGGSVASYPINWGWRANGGVSISGLLYGGLAFMDALVCSKGLDTGVIYKGMKAMHIAGFHEYRSFHTELLFLRDYVHDTLLSESVTKSGLFNSKKIAKLLKEHYILKNHHQKEIMVALDLALAQQIFKAESPQ